MKFNESLKLSSFIYLVNISDHVEGDLRQVVVLAVQDLLEAGDGLVNGHKLAGIVGEHLGDLC